MTKWEYKVVNYVPSEELTNKFGKQGWELAAIYSCKDNAVFYFKRPIEKE